MQAKNHHLTPFPHPLPAGFYNNNGNMRRSHQGLGQILRIQADLGRIGGRSGSIRRLEHRHHSSKTSNAPIGFVGVGNMGSGMIKNLASKGFVLKIFDANKSKASQLKEKVINEYELAPTAVQVADSIQDIATSCPTVCISLPSEAIGRKVFFDKGASLLFSPTSIIKTIIDHGTVSVQFSKDCHKQFGLAGITRVDGPQFASASITYIDAPVSGGPEGAAKGTLSIMVGGTVETFKTVKPILQGMGSLVVRMGPSGAGTAAKLINQLLTGVHIVAAAEAYSLAKSLDISDTRALLGLLERSWGNSTMLQRCGNFLAKAEDEKSTQGLSTSGAPIRNFAKDFGMIQAAAQGAGLKLPITSLAGGDFHRGVEKGLQEWDIAAMTKLIEGFDLDRSISSDADQAKGN